MGGRRALGQAGAVAPPSELAKDGRGPDASIPDASTDAPVITEGSVDRSKIEHECMIPNFSCPGGDCWSYEAIGPSLCYACVVGSDPCALVTCLTGSRCMVFDGRVECMGWRPDSGAP